MALRHRLGPLLMGMSLSTAALSVSASQPEPDPERLAERLMQNETGGVREQLAWWSPHEPFPSLGIGHFIWIPAGVSVPFEAQFPQWVRFAVEHGERVPRWLQAERAPWSSREAFYADPRRAQLLDWLERTRSLQARFVMTRFQTRWRQACAAQPDCAVLDQRVKTLWQQPGGAYALLDYVNFKGLGDNAKARYAGQGWGLIQVLRAMPSDRVSVPAFVAAAHKVLQRRIAHAPRDESRWWPGWKKRLDRYVEEAE